MLRGKGQIDVVSKLGDVVVPPMPTIVRAPLKPVLPVEKHPEDGAQASDLETGDGAMADDDTVVASARPAMTEQRDDTDPAGSEEEPVEFMTAGAAIARPAREADDVAMPAVQDTGLRVVETSPDKREDDKREDGDSAVAPAVDAGALAAGSANETVEPGPVMPVEPAGMHDTGPVETVDAAPVAAPEPGPVEILNVETIEMPDLNPIGTPAAEPIGMPELEPVEAPAADPVVMPTVQPVMVPKIEPVEVPRIDPVEMPKVEPEAKETPEARDDAEMPDPSGFADAMPAMHNQAGGKFGWFCGFEDEDDLQIIIGGDADAVGEHTFTDGKITGSIEDKGFVTVGRAQAVFEASADDGDDGFAFATAETFAEVLGADFVFTFTREWHGDDEAGFSSTAADKSITTVYAIDFESWSPRHTIEINTTIGMGEYEPDMFPEGNFATFEADLLALGDDTFVELFSDAFTLEDQFSTTSGVATFIA